MNNFISSQVKNPQFSQMIKILNRYYLQVHEK